MSATNLGLHKGGKRRKSEKCWKMSENVRRVSGTNKRSENIGNIGRVSGTNKKSENVGNVGRVLGTNKKSENIGNVRRVSGTNKKSENVGNVGRVSGTNKKGENVGRHWKDVGRGRVRSQVKISYVTMLQWLRLTVHLVFSSLFTHGILADTTPLTSIYTGLIVTLFLSWSLID